MASLAESLRPVDTGPALSLAALAKAGGPPPPPVVRARLAAELPIERTGPRQAADPNFQVRWRWRANDLAVWDERRTNHRALSDHFPHHRVMRRVTVDGDHPVFVPA